MKSRNFFYGLMITVLLWSCKGTEEQPKPVTATTSPSKLKVIYSGWYKSFGEEIETKNGRLICYSKDNFQWQGASDKLLEEPGFIRDGQVLPTGEIIRATYTEVAIKENQWSDWKVMNYKEVYYVFDKVFFISSKVGYLLVTYGDQSKIIKTTDGGETFTEVSKPSLGYIGDVSHEMTFFDENNGIITADYGIWKTEDGGNTFTPINMPDGIEMNFSKVVQSVRDISILSKDHWIIFASTGNCWETNNGGSTWELKCTIKDKSMSQFYFHSLCNGVKFFDGNRGVYFNTEYFKDKEGNIKVGVLYSTKDGGKTWKESYRSEFPFMDLNDFAEDNQYIYGCGLINKYENDVYGYESIVRIAKKDL